MRALVTGGAGYIGSHTAKMLAGAGCEPVVLDNFSTGSRWAVRWGPLVEGDLADTEFLQSVFRTQHVNAVIHFAAAASVGESMGNPRKYFRDNCVNSLNLLDAMLEAGVKHIVFSSSAAVYGDPKVIPIPEDHPVRPINPYGESKLFAERMLRWYGLAFGLRWMALRYFNACGADPDGALGEHRDTETHLIPLAIGAALGQRPHVEVLGSDYPTADGTAVRDYVHVVDLAYGHVLALHYLLDGGESCALNLGAGVGHSVREVITAVGRCADGDRPLPLRIAPRRAGDPASLIADPSAARCVLGWEPRHSSLEEIIETAWRWHRSRQAAGAAQPADFGKTRTAAFAGSPGRTNST